MLDYLTFAVKRIKVGAVDRVLTDVELEPAAMIRRQSLGSEANSKEPASIRFVSQHYV